MNDLGKCEVCSANASQKCGGCRSVLYCTREHQLTHWPKHKTKCSLVKISFCKKMGRHLVATSNINPGNLILKESPFILGPKVAPLPVCVGCLREFDKGKAKLKKYLFQSSLCRGRITLKNFRIMFSLFFNI